MGGPTKIKPILALGKKFKRDVAPPNWEWRLINYDASLESIASEYGLHSSYIKLENWETAVKEHVNWYLYEYAGCRAHNGEYYTFSAKHPGRILVPILPDEVKKGAPKTINTPRDGVAKVDSQLQVKVMELLPDGNIDEVEGKWLYVFSGEGGIDFGYSPPPQLKRNKEITNEGQQPGSAFNLDFPGVYHLGVGPDKLEYEIYVSHGTDKSLSQEQKKALYGRDKLGKPRFELGKKWYILSNPAILGKAGVESRDKRIDPYPGKTKTITIKLEKNVSTFCSVRCGSVQRQSSMRWLIRRD